MAWDSQLTSLFVYHRPLRRGLSPFAVSAVVHGVAMSAISYSLLHAPVIRDGLTERYSVRHLDLNAPQPAPSTKYDSMYPKKGLDKGPGTQEPAWEPELKPEEEAKAESAKRPAPALAVARGGVEGKQTLLQPEFRTHQAMAEEAPIPTIMIWTPELAPQSQIVPPSPDTPTTVPVQASLEEPNEELDMAQFGVSSSTEKSTVPTPPAGSSSPVVVKGPELAQMPPATVSTSDQQPTPTAVLSVSDMRMEQGTLTLPPVNETRAAHKDGLTPEPSGAAQSSRVLTAGNGSAGGGTKSTVRVANGGSDAAVNSVADAASASAPESAEHIQLPKDGKFGVVVVGSSTADQYPEALQIWSDRVAYTVYLHVGLPKAWILQYSELRSAEVAAGGAVSRLEPPWPYDIFRPNLVSRDLNADALMVHGILNESGRLESLGIAFPPDFAHGGFVLAALRRWQFRPARQQGKATPVEVLLIIPEDLD